MAVQSTMLKLGTPAPDFSLTDVGSGTTVSLQDFAAKKALLVMFICRHCPYVKHVEAELTRLGNEYLHKGFAVVAISANDPDQYPDDSPANLDEQAKRLGFKFPYLFDASQQVAKAYTAACTPDLFLFDQQRKLVYRGELDDSRPGNNVPVTGQDLRAAIEAVLAGQPVSPNQKPSIGCSIKWKPGTAPHYAQ
ncbi:MAG: thioredoxin family protein [Candidatus Chisholmbacteria bacterium]|nr:thioredoxin family protein [Candidatus Chisholmbacteria bacterium]